MSAVGPPSGVVTFLFTDVEGSTRRWETDADEMRTALVVHDEVLRNAIDAHDGFLFKHTGDGVCAAFASPKAAVDAAVAVQRELALPVRMGLATGEAQLRDGDYFGAVLNRAARVMSAGHGGQILMADSTASLLSGVDLVDLGPRRLRDLPTPMGVFQVRAQGLLTDFPRLRGVDSNPGNLRPAILGLIGRDSEVSAIQSALRSHRLVTLTGVGGVGKTCLALEVATQLADEFPDGVWVFELAGIADPGAVPDAVAAVLGITQQPGKSVAQSVASVLEGRSRLLVFDNCEQVVDSVADLVEAILATSATVTVLATSREGIGIAEERLWRVPSLSGGAAIALFVERAQSLVSDGLDQEVTAVEDICRRLDGIPLAIELAASRMSSMTAEEVRDRLDDRFKLLVGSRRGLERHQTLRQTVAWSYDLLDDAEKLLLARCSVFSGGFDLKSARAVAGADDVDDYAVLDRLDALVRKSLLMADRSTGRTRFSMLETIRQFAEEQLAASGDAADVRDVHARYFAGCEADILALWDSPRQREVYTWFITETANLRTAFRWAADRGDLDVAATIAAYAGFLGYVTGNCEPITWVEEVIEPARADDHPRLAFLYVIASVCWMAGRVDAAIGYTDACQPLLSSEHCEVPFGVDGLIGSAYLAIGQPERWAESARAQLARGRGANPVARASLVLALAAAGWRDEALSAATGLIDAAEVSDNPTALSVALLAHGYIFREADPARAMAALRRGLTIAQDNGQRGYESDMASTLGRLEAAHGDPLAALDHLTVALRNYHNSGNTNQMNTTLVILAVVLDRLGHYESSATISGGSARNPFTTAFIPEFNTAITHLRDVLANQTYDSLAHTGANMTTAVMVTYASDQIDHARAELNAGLK